MQAIVADDRHLTQSSEFVQGFAFRFNVTLQQSLSAFERHLACSPGVGRVSSGSIAIDDCSLHKKICFTPEREQAGETENDNSV